MRLRLTTFSFAALVAGGVAGWGGVTGVTGVAAQGPVRLQTPTDSLRVFLMTFGPGSAVWERFGHNALWIHDPAAGTDWAYHYGLFDMSEEGFILHFLQGRMTYSMGRNDADFLLEAYRRYGRDATIQELALDQARVRELQAFLQWNYRPENRRYRYDYFRDNCSTRLRDALDRVMGGALRSALSGDRSSMTYREQAVALTAEDALLTTGMDLGLGPLADQPLTHWELAFIPMRFRDDVRDVTIARSGRQVPLVVGEREIPAIGREDDELSAPPHETGPRRRALALLLLGVLTGGGLALAGQLAAAGAVAAEASHRDRNWRATVARWSLAIGGSLWGLVSGVLGLVLLALWALTDHEFAWRNENLLQANPLALGLVVLVPLAVFRPRFARAARSLGVIVAGLAVLGLLLHPLPVTPHANIAIIALMLPIHVGLAWALWRLQAAGPPPPPPPPSPPDPSSPPDRRPGGVGDPGSPRAP